jgi:N-acetylglucosamine malate deacetylase 2
VEPTSIRILTIYAHPDDESFGPSAAMARYARAGAEIYGIFATSGEEGNSSAGPDVSPQELARLREKDTRDATALIGYREIHFLGYYDGRVDDTPTEDLRDHLLRHIVEIKPDVIITFGPAGITRHPDHVAVHHAAVAAFHVAREKGIGVRELYYDTVDGDGIDELDLHGVPDSQTTTWIDVSDTQWVKLDALRIHGRHIIDAADAAEQMGAETDGEYWATFHRAYPPVPKGLTLSGFLEGEQTTSPAE